MPNISYIHNGGILYAKWPGKSVRQDGKVRKIGQIYLGKVQDRDKNIFWTRERGFYTFDPETQKFGEPDAALIPPASEEVDKRKRQAPVIVDFGDACFLDQLVRGLGYDVVIDAIPYQNRDTLYALIAYYTLEQKANVHAEGWLKHSYASFLYPKANFSSQRISEMLSHIGRPEIKRAFLLAHIKYVLSSTAEDVYVIIDSTGMENKCSLPITRISRHANDVKLEFRIIAIVQKSTGLPLYYECIEGNIVDITTIERSIETLARYNCKVKYLIGDAGYNCPKVVEKLVLSGIEFMSRLSPLFKIYKDVYTQHCSELDNEKNIVRFNNRLVSIIKVQTTIAVVKETNKEINGYIYLCKDIERHKSLGSALLSSIKADKMKTDELLEVQKRFGIFEIVSTRNLTPEEVLPEYYIRQSIEQYFDFGKQYANFLPVRQHNIQTLNGHMLVAFIASFFTMLIKKRLNLLDLKYAQLPRALIKEIRADKNRIKSLNDSDIFIIQDKFLDIFKESPATLFYQLRWQKADIYDDIILPTIPTKQANNFYQSFGLSSPFKIYRKQDNLKPYYKIEPKGLTRELVFAERPTITDEIIEENREKKKQSECKNKEVCKKTGRGRIHGSKNFKTIERQKLLSLLFKIYQKKGGTLQEFNESTAKKNTKKGRPKGSPNKKTTLRQTLLRMLRRRYASLGGDPQLLQRSVPSKGKGGRPKGSPNRKTVQHRLIVALKAIFALKQG